MKTAGGSGAGTVYHSQLANAGPDASAAHARQRDVYKLALAGSRDMKRLWNDFAAECPAIARLVVADVENERREGAEVSRQLDERLRDAERLVTKSKKQKVSKSSRPKVTKVAKRAEADTTMGMFLQSSNPALRLMAEAALESRG